jgi:hypothetical protein
MKLLLYSTALLSQPKQQLQDTSFRAGQKRTETQRVCTIRIATSKVYLKLNLILIDLAADGDVDLVVCSVRVDRHFQTVRPSIIAGKAVFVEWPLERNLEVAREMAELAAKHNAPTIVGIQGSFSPEIRKLKAVIETGRIGKVVSSSWKAAFGNGGATERKNVRYFVDREVGGNVVTIGVGHSLEFLTYGNSHPVFGSTKLTAMYKYSESSSPMTASLLSAIIPLIS